MDLQPTAAARVALLALGEPGTRTRDGLQGHDLKIPSHSADGIANQPTSVPLTSARRPVLQTPPSNQGRGRKSLHE